jgi:3-hydroxyisobutyrate dehydrogenase-like beta-hydroxyacid dehydrogenase
MGHGVGQSLISQGHRAISPLQGRSEHTRSLAARAGIEDAGDIDGAVAEADLILSILPPDRAIPQAEAVAASMKSTGKTPAYVDCNAISPMTMQKVADSLSGTGCQIIDCGIIGLNPIKTPPTRFYVSGPDCSAIEAIGHDALRVTKISDNVGAASALKMVYAAGTKGVWTLQTALLLTAARQGVLEPLLDELAYSQSGPLQAMRGRVPFLPADSARWVPEMEEIADTFAASGVTDGFHRGAADIFRLLAQSPFADETRETLDTSRTLEEALSAYAALIKDP